MSGYSGQIETVLPGLMRILRETILVAAVVVLGVIASKMFWLVVSGPTIEARQATSPSAASVTRSTVTIDPAILRQMTPFKRSSIKEVIPEAVAEETPETELDLVLKGVRTDGDGEGVAFIEGEDGQDHRYSRGDGIEGLRNVLVDRVYADGVILSRDGRVEKLTTRGDMLGIVPVEETDLAVENSDVTSEDRDTTNSLSNRVTEATTSAPTAAGSNTSSQSSSASSRLSREEIQNIFRWVRFDPNTGSGVAGVTVFPTNAAIFQKSGLKSRDIVQSLGGVRLDETTDFNALVSDLRDQDRIEIALVRGGEPVRLTVRVVED